MKVRTWTGGIHCRPLTIAAVAAGFVFTALTIGPASAHSAEGHAASDPTTLMDCQLGAHIVSGGSCAFDTNSDGVIDWVVSDTNYDFVLDTSALDTDFDGRPETFYTTIGALYGEVQVRYDHDTDGLYDDEETVLYFTDPYLWDSDSDGYSDAVEIYAGSALNPFCSPYGCG